MPKTALTTVNEYIAAQPDHTRRVLRHVRRLVRAAMPGAEEVISYRIPAYKVQGRIALFFAGWKRHYSLYPVSRRLLSVFKDDLARYIVSKGTIRFPLDEPVPSKLIAAIARLRAAEVGRRATAKRPRAKKR